MLDDTAVALLRKAFPVIGTLPGPLFERIRAQASPLRAPVGTVMFETYSPCQAFPMLLSGSIRVGKQAPNGRELRLYEVLPGESCILTSSCLMGNIRYPARGVAESEVFAAVLSRELFNELVGESPAFRSYIFSLFGDRLVALMELVEEVAFRKLDQRLATLLLRRGPLIAATHQNLADELGSVREIVSRLLKGFEEQGLVQLGREQVRVTDPAGLRAVAEPG